MQPVFHTRYYLFALVAGALLVTSFAPFNAFPVAYLATAALFFLMTKTQRRGQLIKLGWAFGVGLFGAGASWVFQSMHGFAQAPVLLAGLLTLLFVMGLALQVALFGWIASYFSKSLLLLRLTLIYPCAWVLVEWVRGWLFTGFPWLLLGHSQGDTWLASFLLLKLPEQFEPQAAESCDCHFVKRGRSYLQSPTLHIVLEFCQIHW